ncbi:ABC transporter ATP-binding protein [Alkalimonas amylolytica]|uniref:Putative ABC transport system ATP-binding protein n=1 Tax=Alkalimonas amylolytica TaxID=152573 RepID=A0A1H4FL61_ALKAM|nr:ATP-binding cassette domain-containing protein [Alkalimonas amylolytica]SEA97807.1 putative ABC transport system ATP-binding protein [Alkalimonas amylolytica]
MKVGQPVTDKPKKYVIELKNLRFRWPGKQGWQLALDNLQLEAGQHLFIRGASGSGKTTLLNLLSGITTPNEGGLWLQQTPMHKLSAAKRDTLRAQQIGVVFQQLNLIPYLSVLDNVLLVAGFANQSAGELTERAIMLLQHLGLNDELHHQKATELSVGQQQRVAIARALLLRPALLIADEPTSALDADNRDAFMRLMLAEATESGTTVIFVSHDQALQSFFNWHLPMDQLEQGVQPC